MLRALHFDSTDDAADLDDTEPFDFLLLLVVKTARSTGEVFWSGLPFVYISSGARDSVEILPYWSDHMLIVLGILGMFGVNILFILPNSLRMSSSSRLGKHGCTHRRNFGLHHNHITHFIHVTFTHVTFFCLHVNYIDVFHIHVTSSMSLSPAGMSLTLISFMSTSLHPCHFHPPACHSHSFHSCPRHFIHVTFTRRHVIHTRSFLSMSLHPCHFYPPVCHSQPGLLCPCHFIHVTSIQLHVTHIQIISCLCDFIHVTFIRLLSIHVDVTSLMSLSSASMSLTQSLSCSCNLHQHLSSGCTSSNFGVVDTSCYFECLVLYKTSNLPEIIFQRATLSNRCTSLRNLHLQSRVCSLLMAALVLFIFPYFHSSYGATNLNVVPRY